MARTPTAIDALLTANTHHTATCRRKLADLDVVLHGLLLKQAGIRAQLDALHTAADQLLDERLDHTA